MNDSIVTNERMNERMRILFIFIISFYFVTVAVVILARTKLLKKRRIESSPKINLGFITKANQK